MHDPFLIHKILTGALPDLRLRAGPETAVLDPGIDSRNLDAGVVVFPRSTAEVSAVLKVCNESGIAVVPHGGRTGLAGAATSALGQVVVCLLDMNRIEKLDDAASLALVEAGVTLAGLQEAAGRLGLSPGIDLGARDSATIGGMISTNAGGIEAFRHGTMRSRVLGLEAVLADGTAISDLAQVAKCNEGYDIKQLLIGAEGTLGIVTRAVIRLTALPKAKATALVCADSCANAIQAFHALHATGKLLAFELMNQRYFTLSIEDHKADALKELAVSRFVFVVEVEGQSSGEAAENLETMLGAALEDGTITDAIRAKSDSEAKLFWLLREDSWCVDRKYPGGLWYDVSIPLGSLDTYLARLERDIPRRVPGALCHAIGHLGDGNLHLTIAGPEPLVEFSTAINDVVYQGIKEMGGSFSAEHGIGTEKFETLAKRGDAGKLMAMRAVKQAFDPNGIMNPGKVL